MTTISLLLPTRGRKEHLERLFDSLLEKTFDLSRIEIILCIDEDDFESQSLTFPPVFHIRKLIGPRSTMGTYNTKCYLASTGNIVILFNDDIVVRTPNWDRIIESFDENHQDKIYLAYVNDLFKKEKVGSFPILSRRACEILTDPFPAAYKGEHIDYHLFDIFKRLETAGYPRIHYFEDVVFEHMHFSQGKSQVDQTYLDRKMYADDQVFIAYSSFRRRSAERLKEAIEGESLSMPLEKPTVVNVADGRKYLKDLYDAFLKDGSLPFRWRSKLFLWFLWRFLAKNGKLLWVKKLYQTARRQWT